MAWIGQFSLILHIAFAAVWFGAGIRLAGQVRMAGAVTGEEIQPLVEDIDQTRTLILYAVGGTLVFSLLTFFLYGGFTAYGPRFHTSLLLVAVMAGIEFTLIQPAWNAIRQAQLGDGEGDISSRTGRVAMFVGINHLLWTVVLVLMTWRL